VAEHREVCRKFEQERRRKIENMRTDRTTSDCRGTTDRKTGEAG